MCVCPITQIKSLKFPHVLSVATWQIGATFGITKCTDSGGIAAQKALAELEVFESNR